jgi:hypothetical protein
MGGQVVYGAPHLGPGVPVDGAPARQHLLQRRLHEILPGPHGAGEQDRGPKQVPAALSQEPVERGVARVSWPGTAAARSRVALPPAALP